MYRIIVICALFSLVACDATSEVVASSPEVQVSDVAADEHVVFFPTSGWFDQDTKQWLLPVHGWIYEPEDSTARKALFEAILVRRFDLFVDDNTEANFSERLNLLIADNERGKKIVIELAGRLHELPPSAANGHFEAVLTASEADVASFATSGRLPYSAVIADADGRSFAGEIGLVAPSGLSVISDIDDTVKISNVTNRKKLLESTFLLDFAAAPGMSELFANWEAQDASFHFVSSSPWQLYTPLQHFLNDNDFPWATFNLKAVRFRDETLFDLFKKGTETKPGLIRGILDRYPDRSFILVGDSGEQDPEVYAALMREYPDQVASVFIRNVTAAARDDDRFSALFDGIEDSRWHLFEYPGQLDARDPE